MNSENLIIASYIISALLVGGLSINSFFGMQRSEAILQDLKENP